MRLSVVTAALENVDEMLKGRLDGRRRRAHAFHHGPDLDNPVASPLGGHAPDYLSSSSCPLPHSCRVLVHGAPSAVCHGHRHRPHTALDDTCHSGHLVRILRPFRISSLALVLQGRDGCHCRIVSGLYGPVIVSVSGVPCR